MSPAAFSSIVAPWWVPTARNAFAAICSYSSVPRRSRYTDWRKACSPGASGPMPLSMLSIPSRGQS